MHISILFFFAIFLYLTFLILFCYFIHIFDSFYRYPVMGSDSRRMIFFFLDEVLDPGYDLV